MPSPEYTSFDYHTPIHSNSMSKTRSTSPLHFLYPSFHSSASSSYNDYNTASTSYTASGSTSTPPPHKKAKATRTRTQRNRASPSATSSAANDVSRLLDPSYLPSSLASASGETTSTTVKAYVDTNGEMHDPDYRYFPDAVVFRRSSEPSAGVSVAKNAQRRRSGASLGSARRLGGHQQRPQFDWEKELDESALDDEDDYENHSSYGYNNNNNRYTNGNAYTYSPTSRSWSSSTNSNGSNNLPSAYYSPTGTTSTLPTSYEDTEDGALSSPFDASSSPIKKLSVASHRTSPSTTSAAKPPRRRLSRGEKAREEREREKEIREMEEEQEVREMEEKMAMEEEETRRSRRRSLEMETRTSSRLARRREEHRQQQEQEQHEEVDEDGCLDDATRLQNDNNEKEVEHVPTCGQSLRRQWQAFALSFRFGVFRAQRRMMRRVASFL